MKALLFAMPDTMPNFRTGLNKWPNLALCSLAASAPDKEVVAVDLCCRRNLKFMSKGDIALNCGFVRENDVEYVLNQILCPYPKTKTREELLDMGLATYANEFRYYSGYWANVRTKHRSSNELQFLKWKYHRKTSLRFRPEPRAILRPQAREGWPSGRALSEPFGRKEDRWVELAWFACCSSLGCAAGA